MPATRRSASSTRLDAGAHERAGALGDGMGLTLASGRVALLLAAAFLLGAGILGGLARLGWAIPVPAAAAHHGALMIGGFLGSVISLERAVALGHPLALGAPLAAAAGAVLLLFGLDSTLWLVAPALLAGSSALILQRQPQLHNAVLLAAAGAWMTGNALLVAGAAPDTTAAWWFAFLVLTIVAERLELARLMKPRPLARPLFYLLTLLLVAGALIRSAPLYGAALAGLALWLIAFDIARRTLKTEGFARYAAIALLGGYGWLAAAGLAWIAMPFADYPLRDAALHALGLGFVFSMIFAHAPLVVPVIARVRVRYTPFFYVPLAALHVSLLVRLAPGGGIEARQWGGVLNAASVALFAVTLLLSMSRLKRGAAQGRSDSAIH